MKEQIKQFPSLGEQVIKYSRQGDEVYNKKVETLITQYYATVAKYIFMLNAAGYTADQAYQFVEEALAEMEKLIAKIE